MDYSKEPLRFIYFMKPPMDSYGQGWVGGGWCVWGVLGLVGVCGGVRGWCGGGGSLLGCTDCAFTISRVSFP